MYIPNPTPILRLIHIENLPLLLTRNGLHAPNHVPKDGLPYRAIHDIEVQRKRCGRGIPCGPQGKMPDYVPFYFGYRSPMLLQHHTNKVPGHTEGQSPLIYLRSTVQAISEQGLRYVFSDGHGLQKFTSWFDNISELNKVDWDMVNNRLWFDTDEDNDRQRRKQAEFLVHRYCDWSLILDIVVIDQETKSKVQKIFNSFPVTLHRKITVQKNWYY